MAFKAPCDCNAVAGLKVYFPNDQGVATNQVFLFADAHGNNLTGIGHLFTTGAIVKVILHVDEGKAYIQNADTNAYLEGKFEGKADLVDGKVPAEQLPAMDYIPTAEKGAASGVATLGADGKVPTGQLPSVGYSEVETLSDTTKSLFGFGAFAVPNDVFSYLGQYSNQYWWKRKALKSVTKYYESNETCSHHYGGTTRIEFIQNTGTLYVADSVTFSEDTGKHTLVNPEVFSAGSRPSYSLEDKYVYSPDGRIQKYETDTYMTEIFHLTSLSLQESYSGYSAYQITYSYVLGSTAYQLDVGGVDFVHSINRNEYPDSGNDGDFEYTYMGIPFENAVEVPKIATGTYRGTGKYDSANKTSITFDFVPKMVLIMGATNNSYVGRWVYGSSQMFIDWQMGSTSGTTNTATLSGKRLTWYNTSDASRQLNLSLIHI